MRPNELGGQTFENHLENGAVISALVANNQHELAATFLSRIDRSDQAHGNIIPELLEVGEEILELDATETEKAMTAMRKTLRGPNRIEINPIHQLLTRVMVAKYDGAPGPFDSRLAKIRYGVSRLVLGPRSAALSSMSRRQGRLGRQAPYESD